MSRSGYSDDCENMNLYRGTVERAIKGKRGQLFLQDLAAAMDAMPEKRLIAEELVTNAGEVCAIGVICKARGIDVTDVDVEDADKIGKLVGIARSMAAEIEYENDKRSWHNDERSWHNETPEQRWTRMRAWVAENLRSNQ